MSDDVLKNAFNDLDKSIDLNNSEHINFDVQTESVKNSTFIGFFKDKVINLTSNLSEKFSPFINGYYMVFMVNGPWFNTILTLNQNDKNGITTEMSKIDTKQGTYGKEIFASTTMPLLATDIDLPEPTKEYINVSMRSQSINAYQRELIVPDFSIQYMENNELDVIRYHEIWHKTIELYRRGYLESGDNRSVDSVFYDVPYANSIYVLLLSPSYDIRGLFYLPGVKPINLPIKQLLGARNSPKITTYNMSYKGTSLFYKFYNSNDAFLEEFNENNDSSKLAFKFKQEVVNARTEETKNNQNSIFTLNNDINTTSNMT